MLVPALIAETLLLRRVLTSIEVGRKKAVSNGVESNSGNAEKSLSSGRSRCLDIEATESKSGVIICQSFVRLDDKSAGVWY